MDDLHDIEYIIDNYMAAYCSFVLRHTNDWSNHNMWSTWINDLPATNQPYWASYISQSEYLS